MHTKVKQCGNCGHLIELIYGGFGVGGCQWVHIQSGLLFWINCQFHPDDKNKVCGSSCKCHLASPKKTYRVELPDPKRNYSRYLDKRTSEFLYGKKARK